MKKKTWKIKDKPDHHHQNNNTIKTTTTEIGEIKKKTKTKKQTTKQKKNKSSSLINIYLGWFHQENTLTDPEGGPHNLLTFHLT